MTKVNLVVALIIGAGVGFSLWTMRPGSNYRTHVAVSVPPLSGDARVGERMFNENCATCHGANAAGSDQGPPLVHKIYEPGHHADGSFYNAVRNGVRAHHWNFGDMPPQPGVSADAVSRIIAYVRTLQRANGIN